MKVLWISNIVFPEALQLLTGEGNLKASGGWMLGAAEALLQSGEVELAVAAVSPKVKSLVKLDGEKIAYYLLPFGKGNERKNDEYRQYWRSIHDEYKPNVVHIHGTEYSHGLSYVDECGADNVVVSIQGMTSVYARYYHQGISKCGILRNITARDILKGGTLQGYRNFIKRGRYERELLEKVNNIIGRTSWDRSHAWAINPKAKFHVCNETLRSEFYEGEWSYEGCDKHSIFVSQASYPIKGVHMLLQALPLVLRQFPDTVVRIAGADVTYSSATWKERLKQTDYGKYIQKLIKRHQLSSHVFFTGALDATQMKNEYLKANVFVSPSSIENSPNSLGEAQMLGVPCISSYVGGTMDMIVNADCGYLYRFEETEMLAYKICEIFTNSADFDSQAMIAEAKSRHNPANNASQLLAIYREMSR